MKKKVSGEIAFDLISLFHVQIQEPTRSSTKARAFVFPAKFHYHKMFEKKVNDNLSVCVDEHSLCDLSITGDLSMIYQIKFINVK